MTAQYCGLEAAATAAVRGHDDRYVTTLRRRISAEDLQTCFTVTQQHYECAVPYNDLSNAGAEKGTTTRDATPGQRPPIQLVLAPSKKFRSALRYVLSPFYAICYRLQVCLLSARTYQRQRRRSGSAHAIKYCF